MKTVIPHRCPSCGAVNEWRLVHSQEARGGFSAGKAATGAFLLGPLGLIAGTGGKKIKYLTYQCSKCGRSETYEQ